MLKRNKSASFVKKGRRKIAGILAVILALSVLMAGCSGSGMGGSSEETSADSYYDGGGQETVRILSGSENKELGDVLTQCAKQTKVNIEMDYKGSVDIMRELQGGADNYDAVWPASSMWVTMGDTNHKVKHAESVSVTPVVFGIRQSLAEELGFTGSQVKVADLLDAITSGKLKFCMTSATQSNSGCCAYIGFLYALLGNPEMITSDDLKKEDLQKQMQELLSGVDRSSGSSDWLKDMFVAGDYDAMVNYECLMISANQELEKAGKETLYTVYPEDGLSIADSPLGYVDNGDSGKEEAFLKIQEYLLSADAQDAIQKTGRRTGYSQSVSQENRSVFNEDWGIQPDRVLSPFRMPSAEVLTEALDLYQTTFRKPSLTVYCLDYSGSMTGDGSKQLVSAMEQILIQSKAKENLLQASSDEINIVIPFDDRPLDCWSAKGNGSEIEALYDKVKDEDIGGGTDIYAAAQYAFEQLKNYDLNQYNTAVILMTDGMSMDYWDTFKSYYEQYGSGVPVFSIMFGDADSTQLDQIAELTNARVFDGRSDLVSAFRAVKGYN